MNKKISRILKTNVTLYMLCLALFVLAAIPIDLRLAIGEAVMAILVYVLCRKRSRSTQQSLRQYLDRLNGGMDSARASNMLFAPLPMMVFSLHSEEILWGNDSFMQLSGKGEELFDMHVEAVVPQFNTHWILEDKRECPELVMWNDRIYRVFGSVSRHGEMGRSEEPLATTYWMDVTELEQMRQTLEMTQPVVAILMIDNYEELMKACPESKRSAVLAALEEKLNEWAAPSNGLLLGYDRDRFLFVFEEKDYTGYAEKRFDLLERVREVVAGEGVAATLSIGIGRDGDSFEELFKNAAMALEMALSRGGDQAVVKDLSLIHI